MINNEVLIAGVDEAGRGPLAGPVVASAVILPKDVIINGLADSKKLSSKRRDELFDLIKQKSICIGIGIIDEKKIDEINILQATFLAMHCAINNLPFTPDEILIDGNLTIPSINISQKAIIDGDDKVPSISAASIIAKVTRDRIMIEFDKIYPNYGFAKHKGYGTPQHYSAIKKFGLCDIHRRSFLKNLLMEK